MQDINIHVSEYLDYYLDSEFNPKFAVMLTGEWGSGKTTFLDIFFKKLEDAGTINTKNKPLKISLYGLTNFSEIEDQIFQQIHPILASKEMAFAGTLLKGILRASIKLDLNSDGKSETTIHSALSELNIREYLKNIQFRILVFDDLERSIIPFGQILGFINTFIEKHGSKVIIIANEGAISKIENNNFANESFSYFEIKEKIIGKTFSILPDFESSFNTFTSSIKDKNLSKLLRYSQGIVYKIFKVSKYNNLRFLQHSLWDFERLYTKIDDKFKANHELINDFLTLFIAFSFELESKKLIPSDIEKIQDVACFLGTTHQEIIEKDEYKNAKSFVEKYRFIEAYEIILPSFMWKDYFQMGYISHDTLNSSLQNSKYYIYENQQSWIKLYHFRDLEDDEIDDVISDVHDKWDRRDYKNLGKILHICSLQYKLSLKGLYDSKEEDILDNAKAYIDFLKNEKLLPASTEDIPMHYNNMEYAEKESEFFSEISKYISDKIEELLIEQLPVLAEELIELLLSDPKKFWFRVFPSNTPEKTYSDVPIFKYVDPKIFLEAIIKLRNKDKVYVQYAFKDRYDYSYTISKLLDEKPFLLKLDKLLLEYISNLSNKPSGVRLKQIREEGVILAIQKLNEANEISG